MATTSTIDRDALKQMIDDGRPLTLLEALPERYWAAGHLGGARQFPHEPKEVAAAAADLDRDAPVVVYCANDACRNSHLAAAVLVSLGFRDVTVYAGGKADWTAAGLPLAVA